MNRDNALFALLGLVVGFVAAYPVFEVVSTRQPAPHWAANASGPGPEGGAPAAPGGGGPAMEQIAELRARVTQNPEDADAVCELARANLMIQQFDQALPLLESCRRLRPSDRNVLLSLANLYFDGGQWQLARQAYQEFLADDPENPDVRTDYGVAVLNTGQPSEALEIFLDVHRKNPGHWASLYNQVVVLGFHLKDPAAARAGLEELRRLQPNNPDLSRLELQLAQVAGSES